MDTTGDGVLIGITSEYFFCPHTDCVHGLVTVELLVVAVVVVGVALIKGGVVDNKGVV